MLTTMMQPPLSLNLLLLPGCCRVPVRAGGALLAVSHPPPSFLLHLVAAVHQTPRGGVHVE
jgi:hypothetical protein